MPLQAFGLILSTRSHGELVLLFILLSVADTLKLGKPKYGIYDVPRIRWTGAQSTKYEGESIG